MEKREVKEEVRYFILIRLNDGYILQTSSIRMMIAMADPPAVIGDEDGRMADMSKKIVDCGRWGERSGVT